MVIESMVKNNNNTTVRELIKHKDYDYIAIYFDFPEGKIFSGCCRSENGNLISLDGDTHNDEMEVKNWEEWSAPENSVKFGLTVVV